MARGNGLVSHGLQTRGKTMLDWFDGVAGPDYVRAIVWTLLALVVLVIVLVIVKLIRSMTFGTFVAGGRNPPPRAPGAAARAPARPPPPAAPGGGGRPPPPPPPPRGGGRGPPPPPPGGPPPPPPRGGGRRRPPPRTPSTVRSSTNSKPRWTISRPTARPRGKDRSRLRRTTKWPSFSANWQATSARLYRHSGLERGAQKRP